MFRRHVLPLLVYAIYSALKFTWRIEIHESESLKLALRDKRPIVIGHWHGDELGLLFILKLYRICAMTSTSKDGELINRVVHLLGGRTSRGSSTRGGVSALKGIIRLAQDGWHPSVAVDGPKGPIYKVKPGIFEISRVTGGMIFPLTAIADRKWTFEKSWNKVFLPRPFARVIVHWGEGLPAVSREQDSRDEKLAESLETALSDAKQQARNLIAVL
jgi:lysophospholipid acyltransferase (LPLAT)-like uncharacterized protein